ncbi:MAG: thiamine diphosphokinase [Angelakisella sp.]
MGTVGGCHCLVVCAGSLHPATLTRWQVRTDGLIIAADGGYLHCRTLGLTPHLIVGDFDSAPRPDSTVETLVFPARKDDTDCMLALREGIARGCNRFTLLGATGGRLDHTLAAIQSLAWLWEQPATGGTAPRGVLCDRHTLITLVRPGEPLVLTADGYPCLGDCYLSVFALDSVCTGVTLQGVAYPLDNHTLTNSFPLGVSNRVNTPQATVSVATGRLLVLLADERTE